MPTPTRVGSWATRCAGTGGDQTTSPISLLYPSTPAAGDVVLACIYTRAFQVSAINWSSSNVTMTSIANSNAGSSNGTTEAAYWIADGFTQPRIEAVCGITNNTTVMVVSVWHDVDTITPHVVDAVGTTGTSTTLRPPEGRTSGTPAQLTLASLNAQSSPAGCMMFAVSGGANALTNSPTFWTPQTAGWTEEVDYQKNIGVNGGSGITINSIPLAGGAASGTFTNQAPVAVTLGRAIMFGLRGSPTGSTEINEPSGAAPSYTHPKGTGKLLNGDALRIDLTVNLDDPASPWGTGSIHQPRVETKLNLTPTGMTGTGQMHTGSVTTSGHVDVNEPTGAVPSYTHPKGTGVLGPMTFGMDLRLSPTGMTGTGSIAGISVTYTSGGHVDITAPSTLFGVGLMHQPTLQMNLYESQTMFGTGIMHAPASIIRGLQMPILFGTGTMDPPSGLTIGANRALVDGVDFNHPFGVGALHLPSITMDIDATKATAALLGKGVMDAAKVIAPSVPILPLSTDGCDWNIEWDDIARCCPAAVDITDQFEQAHFVSTAVAAIWNATGCRWGVCTTQNLRPVLTCSDCGRPCGRCECGIYDRIDVTGGGKRLNTASVRLSGQPLTEGTDFAIVDGRWLYRMPAGETWPDCNDPVASPAPIEMTVTMGLFPPSDLVENAVLPLVCELIAACQGNPCGLNPAIVERVQREGIAFALVSTSGEGGFGNARIDEAVKRDWPFGAAVMGPASGVFDPRRRVGWT